MSTPQTDLDTPEKQKRARRRSTGKDVLTTERGSYTMIEAAELMASISASNRAAADTVARVELDVEDDLLAELADERRMAWKEQQQEVDW